MEILWTWHDIHKFVLSKSLKLNTTHLTCYTDLLRYALLPKCHALQQCQQRHIDRMRCLSTTLFTPFLERWCYRFVKAAKKQRGNAAESFASILCHANSFPMLWVWADIGFRWHCNAWQIVNMLTVYHPSASSSILLYRNFGISTTKVDFTSFSIFQLPFVKTFLSNNLALNLHQS